MKRVAFQRLIDAIKGDDVAELSRTLDAGADPSARGGSHGESLLCAAFRCRAAVCAKALLDRGAAEGPEGLDQDALWSALRGRSRTCVEMAIAAGADVEALMPDGHQVAPGMSMLMASLVWGEPGGTAALLRAGADPLKWQKPNEPPCLATALAAAAGDCGDVVDYASPFDERTFDMMVDAVESAAKGRGKAGKKLRQASLDTALCAAAERSDAKTARRLLDLGASLDYEAAGLGGRGAMRIVLETRSGKDMGTVAECFAALWERATPAQLSDTGNRTHNSVDMSLASLAEMSKFDPLTERVANLRLARDLRQELASPKGKQGSGPRI